MMIVIKIQIQIVSKCCINIGSSWIKLSNTFNFSVQTIAAIHIIHLWDMINQLLYDHILLSAFNQSCIKFFWISICIWNMSHLLGCSWQEAQGKVKALQKIPGKERLVLIIGSLQPEEGEQRHLQKHLPLKLLSLSPLKIVHWATFHTGSRLQLP